MHKTGTQGQMQSYVSVLRPEKKSVLSNQFNESNSSGQDEREKGQNKKRTSIKAGKVGLETGN